MKVPLFSFLIYAYKQLIRFFLITPSMRISDLAYTVGYNDPKYFSSCFKKEVQSIAQRYITRMMLFRQCNREYITISVFPLNNLFHLLHNIRMGSCNIMIFMHII